MKKLIQTLSSFPKYLSVLVIFLISANLLAQSDQKEPIIRKSSKLNTTREKILPPVTEALNIIINVPGSYSTIQAAINAANNGDIITVDPGTYRENITLNKFVSIRGANYGIDPNTGIRGPESVIQPATSDPDPLSITGVTNFYIGVNGSSSTIDGFTFDGDNPTLTSSVNINGANIDAVEEIGAYDNLSNINIRNNIIKNTNYAGIELYNVSAASTYDNNITNNKFDNIIPTAYGFAVLIYNNCYANINTNVMTRVRIGVQTGNFEKADLGTNHSISNNSIESYRLGIWHNLAYSNCTTFDILNNIITTVSGAPNNNGIEISSIGGNVGVNLSNNNVTSARNGINFWNNNTSNTVTVTGGTITGCQVGVFANNYDGYNMDANSGTDAMTGVTINNCDTSIWVRDNSLNSNNATISLNINNATNFVNGTGIGLLIEGADASVSFNGAVPVDFNTTLTKYIRLATNGSDVPSANINAQNVQFGGTYGSGLTDAQLFAVEDKVDHKIDWSNIGLVTYKANNDYVTLNSFYTPDTSTPSIQRGIDAASSGFTVNVDAGTFNENVLANKSVTLIGRGPSSTILTPTVACTGDGINISASNVNVRDLKVTNYNFGLRTSSSTISLYNVESVSNCQFGLTTNTGTNGLNIVKCKLNNNTVGGWRTGTADVVSNVIIDSSEVKGNLLQGTFIAAATPVANTFDYITIKNSDFSNNLQKGMYFEKLRHALIDNVIIDNSGTDPAYGFNNGIDINLKYDTYTDITIQNCSITNCGATGIAGNVDNPSAVTVKARDDAPSYNSDPATLTSVVIKNNFISGPVNGLRFGEFDKVNNSPTGNTVTENHFGNGYSNKAVINKTSNNIAISCNWYGTAVAASVISLHKGALSFLPYLVNGTDNDPAAGFQPVPGSCTGAGPVANLTQSTSYITIQAAINAANPNDVIEASAGTYNEGVTINKTLTLQGVDEVNCIVDGTGLTGIGRGILVDNGVTNVTIKKLTVQNFTGTNGNSDAGIYAIAGNNNLTVEHVTLQNNPNGSGFYANGPINNVMIDSVTSSGNVSTSRGIVIWNGLKENITITRCHVFNNTCCGIELQDGQASGVTITNNNVHDNFDNGIGLVGLQGPGENLVKLNTVQNNGRFGIEIKNPNGSGSAVGPGRIVVEDNTVSRTIAIVDNRDIAGIAAFRRAVLPGNVDVPVGVVIQNNTVSGYTQPSTSEGFGIVVEGMDHNVSGNNVSGCDVGIQRQAGHLPYPGDGDQSNLADTYFGRGNSPSTCGVTLSSNILSNTINTRDVGPNVGAGIVENNNTSETFCSIQAAINDAQTLNGHVINVDSGSYNEQVIVNKSLTIQASGPIKPVVNFTGTVTGKPTAFDVSVANVTIKDIRFKVDLVKLSSAIIVSGTNVDGISILTDSVEAYGSSATASLAPYGNRNAVSINYGGSTDYRVASSGVNNITFQGNTVSGVPNDGFGVPRYFRAGVCTDESGGLFTANTLQSINQDIQVRFGSNGNVDVTNNNLNGGGVEFSDMNAGAGVLTVSGNTFDGTFANIATPGTAVLRLKNNYNSKTTPVNNNTFVNHQWGVSMENYNSVTLNNNSFTPLANSTIFHHVTVNTKSISTNSNSIVQVTVGAVLTNNTFNGSGTPGGTSLGFYNHDNDAASFGTFTIGTSGNENNFNSGPANFALLDNQTGPSNGSVFPDYNSVIGTGPNAITTKAYWATNIDMVNNKFDVGSGLELPSVMSLANLFLLEDKVQHTIDDSGLGFVTVKANNNYVTINSFVTPATTTPSVQRGINAGSASWTVNVGDGTYNEDININKALTVLGQSQSAILRGLYNAASDAVFMSVSNCALKNVTVTRDYGNSIATWNADTKNQGVNIAQTTTGVTIDNVRFHSNRNAIFCNNAQSVTITNCIIEDNRTGIHFGNNVSGAEVHNNFIRNNFTHGVLFNYDLATTITATNVHVTNNSITGNWYSQVNFQRNAGPVPTGDHTGLLFSCNWYGTLHPMAVPANAAEPGYTSQVPSQFGGTDPGLNRQLYGIEIARCPFSPWLTNGTDDDLVTAGFQPVPGSCNGVNLTALYVNDNSLSGDHYTSAVGNDANLGTAASPFATMNFAMSVANPQDTIWVDAGTYVEDVVVNKDSISIRGSNYLINPNTGSRVAESVVMPATDDPELGVMITLQQSNTTLDGFLFNGDNPSLNAGYAVGSADVNTSEGICNGPALGPYNQIDHIKIKNNIFNNFDYQAIYLEVNFNTNHSWNYITDNKFDNMWEGIQTYAIHSDISKNVFTEVDRALSIHGTNVNCDLGFVPRIARNEVSISWKNPNISTRNVGIWVNYRRGTAPAMPVDSNIIHYPTAAPSGKTFIGFYALTVTDNRVVTFSNNTIDGQSNCNRGFYMSNCPSSNVSISASSYNSIKDCGVMMVNNDPSWGAGDVRLNVNALSVTMAAGGYAGVLDSTDNNFLNSLTSSNSGELRLGRKDLIEPDKQASNVPNGDPRATYLAALDISNSTISGGSKGIAVSGTLASANIHENPTTITGAVTGVDIDGGTAAVWRNNITANGTGISVKGNGNLDSATENYVTANTSEGIRIEADAGTVGIVSYNDLSGNTGYAINYLKTTPALNAMCNWYGSTNAAFVTSKINGNVNYITWLSNGTDNVPGTSGFQAVPGSCNGLPTKWYVNDNATTGDVYTSSVGNDANIGTAAYPFLTIAHAMTIAATTDTIYVDVGGYAENVVVTKSLVFLGGKAGADARGRVVGAPSNTVESVINPASGAGFELSTASSSSVLDGFAMLGNVTGSTGVIQTQVIALNNLYIRNNYIKVTSANGAGLYFNKNVIDGTIEKNEIIGASAGTQAIFLDGPDQFHGMYFLNNNVLGGGGTYGMFVDGNRNVGMSTGFANRAPLFQGNLFQGFVVGINGGIRSFDSAHVFENTFNNNSVAGFQGGPRKSIFARNTFSNNGQYGMSITGFNGNPTQFADTTRGGSRTTIQNNFFSNNATANPSFGDVLLSNEAPGMQNSNVITENSFGNDTAIYNNEPNGTTDTIHATCNWYGTTSGVFVAGKIFKVAGGVVKHIPYLTNGTDNDLVTAGFQPVPGSCNGVPETKLYVNDNSASGDVFTTATGNNSNPGSSSAPFLTISFAVSVANPSDTIFVDAGLYQEQVNSNKSLTIRGADSAGSSAATIKAPLSMTSVSNANGSGFTSVVYVTGPSTSFNMSHVLIDGDGRGGAKFSGVYYFEASGSFTNSRITKVRDATYSGVQSGNAFFANHTYDVSLNQIVTVSDNVIDDFQKTGILINELNTHGIVTNNIVTGQSIQHVNGQNGIQFGYGAYGTITGNTVTGSLYNGPATDAASGILLAGVGVDNTNTPTGNVTVIGGAGALANTMSGCEVGLLTDGGGFGYDSNAGVTYNSNTFANNYIHVSHSSPNTVPSGSNVYDKRVDNTSQTNIVYGQIQRSVDDASATNILNVSAHTFTEQVEIHKALTLAGQGSGLTKIVAPASLPLFFVTGINNNRPIVYVHDTSGVTIKNLTVDGAGNGNANYRFIGIGYRNAGGTVRDCEIKAIRETPMNGNQHGVGIYCLDDNGTARTLNVLHNNISDFQKNGTALSGANLTTIVDSNTVTGSGPINFTAQNGIQVSFGAKGTIRYNKISNINYTPLTAASCGILIYQTSDTAVVTGDTVNNCQTGIYMQDAIANVTNSRITNTSGSMGASANWWGVVAENGTYRITGSTINGGDTTKAEGFNPYSYIGETTNITFANNFVLNCLDAIVIQNTGSGTVNGNYNENSLTSNALAINNATTLMQSSVILRPPNTEMQIGNTRKIEQHTEKNLTKDGANGKLTGPMAATVANATCNWYGSTNPAVIASRISGSVLYIPYLTNGTDFNAASGFQPVPGSCNGLSVSTLNIKVVPEGFYDDGTQQLSIKDTARAFLHLNFPPYNVLDSAKSTIDSVTLTGSFQYSQPNGIYYIVVKHRNTIETWSKSGGEVFTAGSTMNYDFTTSASQAFGNNMKQVDLTPVTFAIFSGDTDQDGIVDVTDLVAIQNDALAITSGYVPTDINGDYFVDASDIVIAYNNTIIIAQVVAP